jgi:PadR family transcriptional regulator
VANETVSLLHGSLNVLILKTLSWGPMHGFGIARWIQRLTEDALQLEEGTLYPALYRMENRGLIKAEWSVTENNRRAKYYRLTSEGRKQLARESAMFLRYSDVMTRILRATEQPG